MDLTNLSLYGGALGIAFLGSGHCFGMCGGLAAAVGRERAFSYQIGRAIGYAVVGGIAGATGHGLFGFFGDSPGIHLFFVSAFSFYFFLQAVRMWRGELDHGFWLRGYRWIYRLGISPIARSVRSVPGWVNGGMSVLLPCGWIFLFSGMAASTGSLRTGAFLFLMLWLGSLPALVAAIGGWAYFRTRWRGPTTRRVVASLVFILSLHSLYQRAAVSGISQSMSTSAGLICGVPPTP